MLLLQWVGELFVLPSKPRITEMLILQLFREHFYNRHQTVVGQARWMGGMGWDGMGWDGMGWNGMEWDGMGWNGMEWDGMG